MQTKYVLWRVSNGWILTFDNALWEDWDRRYSYKVFYTLKEFSDWVDKPKPQPRIHGKFAPKITPARINTHVGRTNSR